MEKYKEIRFELTHKCLLNCFHCPVNADSKETDILSLDKIKSILQNYECEKVGLTGGEPLLSDNLEDVIWWLKNNKHEVVLYTTGYAENALMKLKTLKAFKVDKVIFYYHNSIPNIHNHITRIEDSHMKVNYAIRHCLNMNLDVEVYVPPSGVNIYTLDETVDDLVSMGVVKIGFPEIENLGRVKTYPYMIPDRKELSEALDFIKRKYDRYAKIVTASNKGIILVDPKGNVSIR
jgi:MoaA/NifB/PqqE/SkfB family radical SAM enzyme